MPVYLAGLPVNMDELYAIAKQNGLRVIEDAAQAFGSEWKGQRIGSIGDLVSFSFQANKNLSTIEGGCLVLNNLDEARVAEKLRLQGLTRTGMDGMDVDMLGGKDNLTDVNAVIGLHQLKHIAQFQEKRTLLAAHYFRVFHSSLKAPNLQALSLGLPIQSDGNCKTNWHMFQVVLPLEQLTVDRAHIMADLKEQGIGTGVHYPVIPSFSLYQQRGYQLSSTPIAARIGKAILTLPLFPGMSNLDVERIVDALLGLLTKYSKSELGQPNRGALHW
jgi:dTDP-4-amino-4,6-dideoxygalactose transaminase